MSDLPASIRATRRRLFVLLLQAFSIVVLLTVLLLLGLFGLALSRNQTVGDTPLATALESYYLGRGSWDGVEAIAPAFAGSFIAQQWAGVVLLEGRGGH